MLEPLRDADRVQRRLQSPDQLSSTGWRAVGAGTLICWFRWFLHSGLYAGVTFPDLDVVPPTGIQNGPNAERELGSQQSGLSRRPVQGSRSCVQDRAQAPLDSLAKGRSPPLPDKFDVLLRDRLLRQPRESGGPCGGVPMRHELGNSQGCKNQGASMAHAEEPASNRCQHRPRSISRIKRRATLSAEFTVRDPSRLSTEPSRPRSRSASETSRGRRRQTRDEPGECLPPHPGDFGAQSR